MKSVFNQATKGTWPIKLAVAGMAAAIIFAGSQPALTVDKIAPPANYSISAKKLFDQAAKDKALLAAASTRHSEGPRLLLEAGADVHAENDEALRRAKGNGRLDVAQLLRAYDDSDEVLIEAARNGDAATLKRLLGTGTGGAQPRQPM